MTNVPKNFTITDDARSEIAKLRIEWNRKTSDPAIALWIGWGLYDGKDDQKFETLVISFVGESQAQQTLPHLLNISGEKVLLFTTDQFLAQFENKRLDYHKDKGLHLAAAQTI